mmetsp:Transcript_33886/g.95997  ORF Transcript_33886/g.95997 Transcript_33886/m.95997 type:complete len:275 (+) Transcript_33886:2389-3213(+)
MVEVGARDCKDLGELGIVGGHHLRLRGLLAVLHKPVNVLHTAKGLLPHLQLAGHLQLLEAGLQVELKALRLGQVGAVALLAVLAEVGEVVSQDVAEAAKLGGALVLQAKLEGALRSHGVEGLQLGVVAQDVQHVAVCLPQELEPRSHQLALRAVLALVSADVAEHKILRGNILLQVSAQWLLALRLSLGLLGLAAGLLEEVLDDLLQGANIDLQAYVAVLDEAVLGVAAALHLHAEVDVLKHDILQSLLPGAVAFAGDHIVQRLHGRLLLADSL